MNNTEKYIIEEENCYTVSFGKFTSKVFQKHSKKYGDNSAIRIRENVRKTYIKAMIQVDDITKNNNLLLIGKVQSGKTSNLEMLTAMAFDNGYNCVIIYGGYDNKLLAQTCNRFKKTFDIDDQDPSIDTPELFSTDNGKAVDALDETVMETLLASGKPLIFVSMKRPRALERVNSIISTFDKNKIKAFIIDDEGDQASLNTEFKNEKKSRTYEQIINMKNHLHNPLYLSVTATPQANVMLGEYSELRPDGLRLIEPGNGYTGAEYFHIEDKNIYQINKKDVDILEEGFIPTSVYNAINYFIISSAIMKQRGINSKGINYSDMIIHTSRVNSNHMDLFTPITNYIETYKDNINNNDVELLEQLKYLESIYTTEYFEPDVFKNYAFSSLKDDIIDVLKNTHIILQDSKGKITQEHEKYKYHKIYIGGDLLQRGLTFEYLVTTYFTRWPKKSGNMDTIIQRARWFGYRVDYLDLCKIFTTEPIKLEYSGLTESENDLWEQCYSIEKGELTIEDIVIDADSTSLNPTRKNVANYKKIQFTKKWNNQKIGIFDANIIEKNNNSINSLINNLNLLPSSAGRTDEKPSNYYSYVKYEEFINLLNNVDGIFDNLPFNKKAIIIALKDKKIVIQKMYDLNGNYEVRVRSFNKDNNKVSALQQGADTADEENQKYKGDSHVIVDEDAVTIQIFRIRPKIDEIAKPEYDQYMFSIHTPENRKGFIKC